MLKLVPGPSTGQDMHRATSPGRWRRLGRRPLCVAMTSSRVRTSQNCRMSQNAAYTHTVQASLIARRDDRPLLLLLTRYQRAHSMPPSPRTHAPPLNALTTNHHALKVRCGERRKRAARGRRTVRGSEGRNGVGGERRWASACMSKSSWQRARARGVHDQAGVDWRDKGTTREARSAAWWRVRFSMTG